MLVPLQFPKGSKYYLRYLHPLLASVLLTTRRERTYRSLRGPQLLEADVPPPEAFRWL
jgi:hypothetical protein